MFSYKLTSITIEVHDINDAKDLVNDITNALGAGDELPGYISDLFYSIESDYQQFHQLDPDNWGTVH